MLLQVVCTSPDSLLDQSLSYHYDGQLEEACGLLRHAYTLIAKNGAFYDAEVFTRLPFILQELGRTSEGWKELSVLLANGLPGRHQDDAPAQRWLDRATLCDKTRLFLQRDGKYDRAILYGVQFYLARCLTCYHQTNIGKLHPMRSRHAVSQSLRPLLEKADLLTLEPVLVNELVTTLRAAPTIDHRAFMARTAMLITMHRLQAPL